MESDKICDSIKLYIYFYIEKNDSGLKTREAYTHSAYMNCPHVRHACMSKAST